MKRFGIFWGVAVTLALGVMMMAAPNAVRAQARTQESPEVQKDWTLRLGVFVFNSATARGAAGEVGISGLAERTVYHGEGYDIAVGIGYNGGEDVYSIPITVMGIWHRGNLRYGLGAGYAFGKRLSGRGMSNPLIGLVLGYDVRSGRTPLTLDLRYNFISGSNSELDGYSLTLGARF